MIYDMTPFALRSLAVAIMAYSTTASAGQTPAVPKTPVADHHQHLMSPALATAWKIPAPVTADDVVAQLDSAGIRSAAILSMAYAWGSESLQSGDAEEHARVRAENDWTAAQAGHYPGRLVAFCSVNPLKEYAVAEIDRCAATPALRAGLKLHFANSGVDLRDSGHVRRLRRVFHAADEHRMAIVVHARTTISKQRPYGAEHARVFLETLLPAAPDVPVQIAHLAGSGGYDEDGVDAALGVFVDAIAAKDPRVAKLWFDVSGIALIGNWPRPAARVAERIRQLGVERVLWGADGAAGGTTPTAAWKAFTETPLTPREIETIRSNVAPYLRENAANHPTGGA